jgi:hypothetical protein
MFNYPPGTGGCQAKHLNVFKRRELPHDAGQTKPAYYPHMHRAPSLALLIAMACQSAPQSDAPGTAAPGGTTFTRGTPDTTRSDTTRGSAGAQSNEVTLTLDRATFTPGATVTMRITNTGRDTLGYNQCSSRSIERQEGSNWMAHPEPERMCTMEIRILNPKETQTAMTDLPATLTPGVYRAVLTLSRQSATSPGTVRAVSPTFRVS